MTTDDSRQAAPLARRRRGAGPPVAAPGRGPARPWRRCSSSCQWAGLALGRSRRAPPGAAEPDRARLLLLAGGLLAAAASWGAARCQGGRAGDGSRTASGGGWSPALLPAGRAAGRRRARDGRARGGRADRRHRRPPRRRPFPSGVRTRSRWRVILRRHRGGAVAGRRDPAGRPSLLIPLNMRLAGLFAKEGADARLAASPGWPRSCSTASAGMPHAAQHRRAGPAPRRPRPRGRRPERHHHGGAYAGRSCPVRSWTSSSPSRSRPTRRTSGCPCSATCGSVRRRA